jgi:hypothetical protein
VAFIYRIMWLKIGSSSVASLALGATEVIANIARL